MYKNRFIVISLLSLLALVLAACAAGGPAPAAPASPSASPLAAATEETVAEPPMQMEGDMHADKQPMMDDHAEAEPHMPAEHMTGAHAVPDEAAAVPNPVAATEESIAAGASTYAQSCAVCHGTNGEGDGPGSAGLEVKPANLHEEHVQELSDGALFYIITHGRPDTAMPAWENILTEEQRWQVVNFIRQFGQ